MDLWLVISGSLAGLLFLLALLVMMSQMTFDKWGTFWRYLNSLPQRPSTLVYVSMVWLPLGATTLLVALEADYDSKKTHCDDINIWLHVMSFYLLALGAIELVPGLYRQCSPEDRTIHVPRAVYVFRTVGLLAELVWVIAGWTAYPIYEYRDDCNAVGTWSEILVVLFTGILSFIAGLFFLLCFICLPFFAKSQSSSSSSQGQYGSGGGV